MLIAVKLDEGEWRSVRAALKAVAEDEEGSPFGAIARAIEAKIDVQVQLARTVEEIEADRHPGDFVEEELT